MCRAPPARAARRSRACHARARQDTRLPQSTRPDHPSTCPAQDCSGCTAGLVSCRSNGNDRRRAFPSSAFDRSHRRRFAFSAARRTRRRICHSDVFGNGCERARRPCPGARDNSRDAACYPWRDSPGPPLVAGFASRFSLRVVLPFAACLSFHVFLQRVASRRPTTCAAVQAEARAPVSQIESAREGVNGAASGHSLPASGGADRVGLQPNRRPDPLWVSA